ncbi:hypothetical protein [Clostridium brassicae]|uniref:Head-tail adaptor protein n=1 Tax=Clostridium brassicae TaxID=2999072 RepID=A0ABT4D6N0_9CLOT|nr:hypothetical protein [Clostridium brassicae]MCY6957956.1 hypothetical protein [Clostridium brassicae]
METSKLNIQLGLWGMVPFKNELDEIDVKEGKIKDIWCNIVPQHGSTSKTGETDVEKVTTIQKIKCRKLSIKNPKINMFFKDKNGLKYEFLDFYPDYKNNDFWEIKTRIIYE